MLLLKRMSKSYGFLILSASLSAPLFCLPSVQANEGCSGENCAEQASDEADCSQLRSNYKKFSKILLKESERRDEKLREKQREIQEISASIPNLPEMILGYDAKVREADLADFRKLAARGAGPGGWAEQVIRAAKETLRSKAKRSYYQRQLGFFQNGVRQAMGPDFMNYLPGAPAAGSRDEDKFNQHVRALAKMKPEELLKEFRKTYHERTRKERAELESEVALHVKDGSLPTFLGKWNEDLFVRNCVDRNSSKGFCRGQGVAPAFAKLESLRAVLFAADDLRSEESNVESEAKSELKYLSASIERTDELLTANHAGSCKAPSL